MLPEIAFATWHSVGLRAIDLTDPTTPVDDGFSLSPDTPRRVRLTRRTPQLSREATGTIAWTYPIVGDGLIDYSEVVQRSVVIKYAGLHHEEVDAVTFLEGNSNLGNAARLNGDLASTPEAPLVWPVLAGGGAVMAIAAVAAGRRRPKSYALAVLRPAGSASELLIRRAIDVASSNSA